MFTLLRQTLVRKRAGNSAILITETIIGNGDHCIAEGATVEVTTRRRRRDHCDTMISSRLISVKVAREDSRYSCFLEEAQQSGAPTKRSIKVLVHLIRRSQVERMMLDDEDMAILIPVP